MVDKTLPIASGIASAFVFDEGASALTDRAGNCNLASITGTPTEDDSSPWGKGIAFSNPEPDTGPTTYMTLVPGSGMANLHQGPASVLLWVFIPVRDPHDFTYVNGLFSKSDIDAIVGWDFQTNDSGNAEVQAELFRGNSRSFLSDSAVGNPGGAWFMLAASWMDLSQDAPVGFKGYINGASSGITQFPGSGADGDDSAQGGNFACDLGNDIGGNISLHQAIFYRRQLSDAEVLSFHNSPAQLYPMAPNPGFVTAADSENGSVAATDAPAYSATLS